MLQTLRRSSRLATLLVLALVAGPASAALCPHAEPLAEEMDHGAMEMADMAHAPEAPPCHEAPAPEPEPASDADCLSPCCTVSNAPAPDAATPLQAPAPATIPLASAADAPLAPTPDAASVPEPPPPPEAPARLHLLLGRFLT